MTTIVVVSTVAEEAVKSEDRPGHSLIAFVSLERPHAGE